MQWGLLLAVFAAVLTAGATILQAIGARHSRRYDTVDPRLLLSVLRSGAYVVGLIMLTASFVVTLVALHSTPLFVVQAINGASLAFIAALSWVLFRAKLTASEWIAIGTVFAGIVLLVVAQRPSKADSLPLVGQWALLGAAVLLGVIAFTATRLLSGSALPALLAGLALATRRSVAGSSPINRLRPCWSLRRRTPSVWPASSAYCYMPPPCNAVR